MATGAWVSCYMGAWEWIVTKRKTFKKLVRANAAQTGPNYTSARADFAQPEDQERTRSPRGSSSEAGPTEIPLELNLREMSDGDMLYFRTPGIPKAEWYRSRAAFDRLTQRLIDEVARVHPKQLERLIATLALAQNGQGDTVGDSLNDWMSVDLAGPQHRANDIFFDAVEEIGWTEFDRDIPYRVDDLPALWSQLFDTRFYGLPAQLRTELLTHWNAAGQHAIELKPKECLEALLSAERLLLSRGINIKTEDDGFDFEE